MMRSFYDGMQGIKNHQIWLDVVSDNISNVNTYGYKGSRVTFETVFSDVMSTATAPRGERGGINPKEIGLGATVATIQTLHTKGSTEATNKKTDLAIDGDGYFILRDGYTETRYYSRAGAFDFDAAGYYVNPSSGFRVQGWGAERDKVTGHLVLDPITGKSSIDTSESIAGLKVTLGEHLAPKPTDNMHLERIKEKTWLWWAVNPVEKGKVAGYGLATFNETGAYEPSTSKIFESPSDPSPEGSRYKGIYFNPPEDPSDTHGAPPPAQGAAIVKILVDFSGVLEAGGRSTTDIIEQNGYPMGELKSVTIDDRGVIVGNYSNYRSLDLGQIALATFTNPSGLKNLKGTMFEETANSGEADIGTPDTKLRGNIKTGYLEMSNVDLTEEFIKMVLAERGFQANSRSVTTADRLLMELLRMRPQ